MPAPDFQEVMFTYVDRFRDLLETDGWQRLMADLSKNDALTLLYLHRSSEARMSDLADYLRAPMNTATGVVGRLSKRGLVSRRHSAEDKRVVVVGLTEAGAAFTRDGLATLLRFGQRIFAELTPDELALLIAVADRVFAAARSEVSGKDAPRRASRRITVE